MRGEQWTTCSTCYRKKNIVDNMFYLMEKNLRYLEQRVDERTIDLAQEKKKTENLLLRMLPRYVEWSYTP